MAALKRIEIGARELQPLRIASRPSSSGNVMVSVDEAAPLPVDPLVCMAWALELYQDAKAALAETQARRDTDAAGVF